MAWLYVVVKCSGSVSRSPLSSHREPPEDGSVTPPTPLGPSILMKKPVVGEYSDDFVRKCSVLIISYIDLSCYFAWWLNIVSPHTSCFWGSNPALCVWGLHVLPVLYTFLSIVCRCALRWWQYCPAMWWTDTITMWITGHIDCLTGLNV